MSNLLSFIIDPDDDDALLVPQLGRSSREPLPALARPHPPAALVGGKGQQLQGQAGAEDDEAAEVGFRAQDLRFGAWLEPRVLDVGFWGMATASWANGSCSGPAQGEMDMAGHLEDGGDRHQLNGHGTNV